MTLYEEFCRLNFEREPHLMAIDRICRELPLRMRDALSEHLNAPAGIATWPTKAMKMQTAYVDLYKCIVDEAGKRKYERCPRDECLQTDRNGIHYFTIGIWAERAPGRPDGGLLFSKFTIEAVNEETAEIALESLGTPIAVDLRDSGGYQKVAATVIDRLMEFMSRTPEERSGRSPIGFVSPAQSDGSQQ